MLMVVNVNGVNVNRVNVNRVNVNVNGVNVNVNGVSGGESRGLFQSPASPAVSESLGMITSTVSSPPLLLSSPPLLLSSPLTSDLWTLDTVNKRGKWFCSGAL